MAIVTLRWQNCVARDALLGNTAHAQTTAPESRRVLEQPLEGEEEKKKKTRGKRKEQEWQSERAMKRIQGEKQRRGTEGKQRMNDRD